MICSNCGKQLPEAVRFCPNCGAAVQAVPSPAQARGTGKRGAMIAAAVLAGTVIIALAVLALYQYTALARANEMTAGLQKQNNKLEERLGDQAEAAANWETIEKQLEIKNHRTDEKFWVISPAVVTITQGQMFSLTVYYERSGEVFCAAGGNGLSVEAGEFNPEFPLYRNFYISAHEVGLHKLTLTDSKSDTEITVLFLVSDNDYYKEP